MARPRDAGGMQTYERLNPAAWSRLFGRHAGKSERIENRAKKTGVHREPAGICTFSTGTWAMPSSVLLGFNRRMRLPELLNDCALAHCWSAPTTRRFGMRMRLGEFSNSSHSVRAVSARG